MYSSFSDVSKIKTQLVTLILSKFCENWYKICENWEFFPENQDFEDENHQLVHENKNVPSFLVSYSVGKTKFEVVIWWYWLSRVCPNWFKSDLRCVPECHLFCGSLFIRLYSTTWHSGLCMYTNIVVSRIWVFQFEVLFTSLEVYYLLKINKHSLQWQSVE